MKTTLYRNPSSNTEQVHIGDTDEIVFAQSTDLLDTGLDVAERAFRCNIDCNTDKTRYLRVFKAHQGDYGFRFFDDNGDFDDKKAFRLFPTREAALGYLNKLADVFTSDKFNCGWKEIPRHE